MIFYALSFFLVTTGCSLKASLEAILAAEGTISITEGSSFNFPNTSTVGSTSEKEIHLNNSGKLALTGVNAQMTYSTLSQPTTPFTFKGGTYPGVGGTCETTLNANSSCIVVIQYDPTNDQADSGRLTFSYSMSSVALSVSIALTGTGVTPAILTISDANTYDFGSVAINTSSATKTFTVTNSGGAATSIMEANLATPFLYDGGAYPGTAGTCGTGMTASSTCTLVVKFSPSIPGLSSSAITLSYNDGLTSQTASRPVIGTGYVPNVAPVATAQSVVVYGVAKAITLAGTDANGDSLTYTVVAAPSHGALSGTAPSLTYTPTAGYVGADSFTFKVNDGTVDSPDATVTIDDRVITIFLRSASNTPPGNDGTAAVGDPAHPYLTAQAAVVAALAQTEAVKMDLGVGSFGDISLDRDLDGDITWVGVSYAQSFVNNVTTTGADGVSTGGPGAPGPNILLKSDGSMKFNAITSNGGNATDCTDVFYTDGSGGAGGNIELGTNVRVGQITTWGGTGGHNPGGCSSYPLEYGPSGNAGNVTIGTNARLDSNILSQGGGYYSANQGGNGGNISVASGVTLVSVASRGGGSSMTSGSGGTITLSAGSTVQSNVIVTSGYNTGNPGCISGTPGTIISGAMVSGYLDARATISYCNTNLSPGGTIIITDGTVAGDVFADGVSDMGNSGGLGSSGGSVSVDIGASVVGSIYARAGCGVGGGTGGTISMSGTSGSLNASVMPSCGLYGNNGGTITVNGPVSGNVTANGDDAQYNSPYEHGGNGGTVTVNAYGTISGTINTSGGRGSYYYAGQGGNGGAVNNYGIVHSIDTRGGSGEWGGTCGGAGGDINIYNDASAEDLFSSAGAGDPAAPGCVGMAKAHAGAIFVGINSSAWNIEGRGAGYNDGGGAGASFNYSCSSPTYGFYSTNIQGGSGYGSPAGDGATSPTTCTP